MHARFGRVVLRSKRTFLRPIQLWDAEEIVRLSQNPDVVQNFSFFSEPLTVEREREYIGRILRSQTDIMFIMETVGRELIGACGLHEIDERNDTARLGIIIFNTEYWNQGYAKEAILKVLEWAFSEVGIHKVYLNVFSTNEKAIHIYESLGFSREGCLRREYKIRGSYVDLLRYAIIRPDSS